MIEIENKLMSGVRVMEEGMDGEMVVGVVVRG